MRENDTLRVELYRSTADGCAVAVEDEAVAVYGYTGADDSDAAFNAWVWRIQDPDRLLLTLLKERFRGPTAEAELAAFCAEHALRRSEAR